MSGRNDPALLALDREEVHRRAASMRSRRPFWWGAAVSIVGVAIAASMFVFPLHKWTTGDLGEHVLRAWMVLFMLYFLAVNIGRPDFILYLVRRCANVFQGTSGVDDARPVADWLDRHWRWFAPPAFLTDDTVWAIGRWRDRPSLLTFERSDSRLSFAAFLWFVRGLTSGPRGRRQGFDTPPSMICRLSVFIGGSTLRTDVQAQATLRELHDWGWGVVGTPGGVYVYHRAYERTLRLRVFLPILDKVINATVAQPQASEGT